MKPEWDSLILYNVVVLVHIAAQPNGHIPNKRAQKLAACAGYSAFKDSGFILQK